jgi:DNA-binding NarL/FixJ family response regulator
MRGSKALFNAGLDRLRAASRGGYADFLEAICSQVWSAGDECNSAVTALTASERQTLIAMAHGLSNKAIAERHKRSPNTVKSQVSAVLRKLGAQSRSEAVAIARRRNLIDA